MLLLLFGVVTAWSQNKLVAYEYWYNNDFANKQVVSFAANTSHHLISDFDVSSFPNGVNVLNIRYKDENGKYSSVLSKTFVKLPTATVGDENKIAGYRYWMNDDFNTAVNVRLETATNPYHLNDNLNLMFFPKGVGTIHFQFQDTKGQWSSVLSKEVENIRPFTEHQAEMALCASELPYQFGTQSLTQAGQYTETFTAVSGADSIVTLTLQVNPTYNVMYSGDGLHQEYMVNDDFEGDALGSLAGWAIKYNGTGDGNQKVVDNTAKNGSKSLQLEGASSWAADLYKAIEGNPEMLTIESWINVTIGNGQGSGLGLVNYGAASWGARTSRISFENNRIVAGATGELAYDIQAYTPGEWYHIRMEHNMVAKTYSVYINGQKVSGKNGATTTDVFPMFAAAPSQHFFLCAGNATTTRVYFDDIKMYQQGTVEVCAGELPFVFGSQLLIQSGVYSETFSSVTGCDSVVTVKLAVLQPDITVTANGATLTANAEGAAYQWVDCNNGHADLMGETNRVFTAPHNGLYAVKVTHNGCTGTSECVNVTAVGMVDNAFSNSIIVYPNPTNGFITVRLGEYCNVVSVLITDLNGKEIKQSIFKNADKFDMNLNVPSGIYFLTIRTNDKTATIRVKKN